MESKLDPADLAVFTAMEYGVTTPGNHCYDTTNLARLTKIISEYLNEQLEKETLHGKTKKLKMK